MRHWCITVGAYDVNARGNTAIYRNRDVSYELPLRCHVDIIMMGIASCATMTRIIYYQLRHIIEAGSPIFFSRGNRNGMIFSRVIYFNIWLNGKMSSSSRKSLKIWHGIRNRPYGPAQAASIHLIFHFCIILRVIEMCTINRHHRNAIVWASAHIIIRIIIMAQQWNEIFTISSP